MGTEIPQAVPIRRNQADNPKLYYRWNKEIKT